MKLQCLDLYQSQSINFTIDESIRRSYVNNPGCPSLVSSSNIRLNFWKKKLSLGNMTLYNNSNQEFLKWIKHLEILMELLYSNRLHKLCFWRMLHWPLGCISPGKINGRNMVISRKKIAYQRVGTTSSKDRSPDIS